MNLKRSIMFLKENHHFEFYPDLIKKNCNCQTNYQNFLIFKNQQMKKTDSKNEVSFFSLLKHLKHALNKNKHYSVGDLGASSSRPPSSVHLPSWALWSFQASLVSLMSLLSEAIKAALSALGVRRLKASTLLLLCA